MGLKYTSIPILGAIHRVVTNKEALMALGGLTCYLPGLKSLCCLSRPPPAGGDDEVYQ